MCGIAGLVKPNAYSGELAAKARLMADQLAHRGPDGDDVWVDEQHGVALSHRRLSIIDLSPAGAQPMISASGRWAISYNGEVYNSEELRRHEVLSRHEWRGHSDTEVILESVAKRGLDDTLAEVNGMFAIALFDRERDELHLIRDRLGIKPLFYARIGPTFLFASELKSILAVSDRPEIDVASVASFLKYGYVPAPHSIFRHFGKLLPGEILTLTRDREAMRRRYWRLDVVARKTARTPLSDHECVAQLDSLLLDAVSRQMVSDVPIGAFLSGGIDSSAIVAMMVRANKGSVKTFSIGFPELGFDESNHAAAVANHLGTDHTELSVGAELALRVVPKLPEMYDEPFSDSSQIPTYLVSRLTREHVTVALSGDGGDELFGGYNRYRFAGELWPRVETAPIAARRLAASVLRAIPINVLERLSAALPSRWRVPQLGDKIQKIASILPLDREAIYRRLISQVETPSDFVEATPYPLACEAAEWLPFLEQMQFIDTCTYLPDDILQKVDRASMAVALEVRPPMLDHRVVEFASGLSSEMKIRGGRSKWVLRQVLDRYVPRKLIDRPKMGFGIPLSQWLREPLKEWASDLLNSADFGGGIIDRVPVQRLWSEHSSGRRNHAYQLWTILSFEAWRLRWASAR